MSEVSKKIHKLRTSQDLSQIQFAEALGTSQSRVSEWELGATAPSAEGFVKLAAQAAKSDADEALFFWQQAGLDVDAVRRIDAMLLEKREGDTSLILPIAEELLRAKLGALTDLRDKETFVLVPPFTEGRWAGQGGLAHIPIRADFLESASSACYVELPSPSFGRRAGVGVSPGDFIIFERSAPDQTVEDFLGEEVVNDYGDFIEIGRVVRVWHGGEWHTALLPSDEPPMNKSDLTLHDETRRPLPRINEHGRLRPAASPKHAGERVLGRFVGRISNGTDDAWRRASKA
jgi:transcriptional regulator with XRE-family HTH domain